MKIIFAGYYNNLFTGKSERFVCSDRDQIPASAYALMSGSLSEVKNFFSIVKPTPYKQ